MLRKLSSFSFLLLLSFSLYAQSTYLPLGDEAYEFLSRMETKSGYFSNDLFLSNKAVSRKDVYTFLSDFKNEGYNSSKTDVDNYHLFEFLSENGEWQQPNGDGAAVSKYSLGPFYKRQPDFLYVHKPGFFWVLNPVFGFQLTSEQKPDKKVNLNTVEGLETRGLIGNLLGFSLSLTNNNIQPVSYQQQRISHWNAVPGAGSFKKTPNGYRYLLFEGDLNMPLLKDYITLDVGYGKHFIGNGIRSLFLSDYAGSNFYVGINTKIWRLNYENLYMRLEPNDIPGFPTENGYKYATVHYLSTNIRPWLNIGLFETVVFSRNGGYEVAYMNPIIFYRAIERSLGSPDKVSIGLNANAIVAKSLNFYGQFLLNEFTGKEFFSNTGYWANKWGVQLGAKYYDAFTVSNLDLQAEMNMVRPYTYAHSGGNGLPSDNFSTWNQPLAHPLGAGFQEVIGKASYQPFPRFSIEGIVMAYRQGVDTGNQNFGNDIFKSYSGNHNIFGIHMINGPESKCLMTNLNVSYELRPRLFLFAGGTFRHVTTENNLLPPSTDLFFNAGFRLNLTKHFQNWY